MAAVAFTLFTPACKQAMLVAPALGALSGFLVRRYGTQNMRQIGLLYGSAFQSTAAVTAWTIGLLAASIATRFYGPPDRQRFQHHARPIVRTIVVLSFYPLSYYALNAKWPLSHKAAIVNCVLTTVFTGLALQAYNRRRGSPETPSKTLELENSSTT